MKHALLIGTLLSSSLAMGSTYVLCDLEATVNETTRIAKLNGTIERSTKEDTATFIAVITVDAQKAQPGSHFGCKDFVGKKRILTVSAADAKKLSKGKSLSLSYTYYDSRAVDGVVSSETWQVK